MTRSLSHPVADPVSAGVDPARLDVLLRRIRLEVESGALPSAQVAVARNDLLVAFETYGDASRGSRYVLQSTGRPVVAGLIWKLVGDGELRVDERVAEIIPEFGTNGKDVVTVEQVLTHTAGFPLAPLGYPAMLDRDDRLAAMASWRLAYEPGGRLEYHLTSAAWVIAELVERRGKKPIGDYLRDEIARPLGLGSLELGVPVDRQHDIAPFTLMGASEGEQKIDPWGPWFMGDPRIIAAGEPSHALVGSAVDLVLYYQALLHSDLWSRAALEEGTRPRFTGVPHGDKLYGGDTRPVTMGLFVTLRGETPSNGSWMPITSSPGTFGHGGAASQLGFLDPETGVSFAMLSNGYPASGYDYTRLGENRITNIGNLAADLIG
ncbi:MAG: beta-lactamase family protein [Proteobacteria bacterium]|nr:beta-lactamase family protein [Pseudomonadota bacterium]